MLAIDASGLTKTYAGLRGRHVALHPLDLQVERGAAFGLIGLNGAGKTTFIKLLLGVVRPTGGEVRVLGGSPEDVSVRARIGYLPERLHLAPSLTPRGVLASVARYKRLTHAEEQIARQLRRVGLEADAARKVGGFSKGMKQRLGLAAALLGEPELLILDEPTDGIDPLGRAEVRRILGEERARGATIFLNSHLLSETERICDRIGILARGRLARMGPLAALCGSGKRHRVRFAFHDPQQIAALGFVPAETPGVYLVDAADATELNELLDRARATGALLTELSAELRDLEEVLAEAVAA